MISTMIFTFFKLQFLRRLYALVLDTNIFSRISEDKPRGTLNISVAKRCTFMWRIETKCSSFSSSWNVDVSVHKKWNFPLRISPVNLTNLPETADLVTFTGEILNRKLHFLRTVLSWYVILRDFSCIEFILLLRRLL